ncbi:MAG: aromatic ring-hydroxylating dioxygenase subunit alpha [Actinomycetota bacterium]|nr:aromatic ring-hydroxylating dioxygenase subunit alpha [Actinomycetota bacterium]
MTISDVTMPREIPDPPGIAHARTLCAAWYADPDFFATERHAVFRSGWVCAGVTDEIPPAGSWTGRTVGGIPILLVRDRDGALRGFLNVCRHRAAPLCEEGETNEGPLIRCPYHSWLYRLDGSLAKAQGVGAPADFDLDEYSLEPIGVATWRRLVFVNLADPDATLDLGPLAAAVDRCPIEEMTLVLSETDERRFNWKALLENYSENYHTPFVHPEIDTTSTEDYPMVSDGPVLYAWDRPLRPGSADDEQIRHSLLPGEPGWERLFDADTTRPYDVGSYLTIWPNAMINIFPDAILAMWMEPVGPNRTVVERRLYALPGRRGDGLADNLRAHAIVHQQDVDICEAVQRSHDAGLDADGVLATFEERGVYFVHENLRSALASDERTR